MYCQIFLKESAIKAKMAICLEHPWNQFCGLVSGKHKRKLVSLGGSKLIFFTRQFFGFGEGYGYKQMLGFFLVSLIGYLLQLFLFYPLGF